MWEREGRWILDKSSWEGEGEHNSKHSSKDFSLIGVGHREERHWFMCISSHVRWHSGLTKGKYAVASLLKFRCVDWEYGKIVQEMESQMKR